MKIRVNKPQNDFTIVPNYVGKHAALSAEAVGVLVFVMTNPDQFTVRVPDIKARFGIGQSKWLRISKELRDAGALVTTAVRGDARLQGKEIEISWPVPIVPTKNDAEGSVFQSSENRTLNGLKSNHKGSETRSLNKRDIKKGARESEVVLKSQWLSAATGLPFSEWKAQQDAD